LLGRLAFALMFTRDLLKRKKKKPKQEETRSRTATEEDDEPESMMVQPSEMAPINTPDGELAGYNVLLDDDPPTPKKRVRAEIVEESEPPAVFSLEPEEKPEPASAPAPPNRPPSHDPSRVWTDDDDDATPYEAKAAEVPSEENAPSKVVKASAEEMELLDRTDKVKPPKSVWNAEVFAFLLQPGTISAMVILCGLALLAGSAVRLARMFNPVAGAE
jgi:type IV secretory pathway VirB10-like protein